MAGSDQVGAVRRDLPAADDRAFHDGETRTRTGDHDFQALRAAGERGRKILQLDARARQPRRPDSVPTLRIDHVIYAAEDLDAAAARIRDELGLTAVTGGRHVGHGTRNLIVPLGGGYLELLGVADAQEAAASPFGNGLLRRLDERGDGWLAWVVAVPDADAVARRLGSTITTLSREGLSARLTGVAEAMREPFLPFFISRDPGVPDPGASGSAGGITWIELAGNAARLERWLDSTPLPLRVVDGPPAVRTVGIGDQAFS